MGGELPPAPSSSTIIRAQHRAAHQVSFRHPPGGQLRALGDKIQTTSDCPRRMSCRRQRLFLLVWWLSSRTLPRSSPDAELLQHAVKTAGAETNGKQGPAGGMSRSVPSTFEGVVPCFGVPIPPSMAFEPTVLSPMNATVGMVLGGRSPLRGWKRCAGSSTS